MSDFQTDCHLCAKMIIHKLADDGSWPMFNLDGTEHDHLAIATTTILSDIHYKDEEDKTTTIGEMTLTELEDRIRRLSSQEAAMKLGSYLHATNGFVSRVSKKILSKKISL